jgi:PAS domain S-box-containing protein
MLKGIFEPNYDVLHYNFYHSQTPLIIFTLEGDLLHLNPACAEFLGVLYPERLTQLNLFKDFQIGLSHIDRIKSLEVVDIEVHFDHELFSRVTALETIKNNAIDILYNIKNVEDRFYLLHIERTLSHRESITNVLMENDQFLHALNEGKIALWDWNLVDNTFYFSKNFYEWFDYDMHFVEKDASLFFNLIHPEDIDLFQAEIHRFLQGVLTEFSLEFRLRLNEIDYIWLSSSANIIRESGQHPSRLSGVFINTTTQKVSTLDFEIEKCATKNLFNNMDSGFAIHRIIIDEFGIPSNYEYVFVNPAYEKMTGYTSDSLIGYTYKDVPTDFDGSFIERVGSVALNGGSIHFMHFSKKLKRYFNIIAYQTEPHFFAAIFSDITEITRAERALYQADKMSSVGQLAGGIAHDFNNHLQIIRGYTEMIEEKLKIGSTSDLGQYLEQIHYSVKHSSNMIKQLLVFSRDEQLEGVAIDFHLLLHQTKSILTHTINRNIPIQLLLDAKSHTIIGDETLLQNAIINMCLNSRDALPNGGLILIRTNNITFDKPAIVGSGQIEPGTYLKISIRDNGDGIAPEDLPYIFEPFYTTKPNKGTGMGLSAVFGTVKNHNGAIDVSSVCGEFTQFDIYLKISSETVHYAHVKSEPTVQTFVPYNILLVDDEPIISLVISEYLNNLGHSVTVYNSPNELLGEFNTYAEPFDIVLLDVIMPEMNGFELLQELLLLEPNLEAIFLSGYSNKTDIPESIKSHILDYIEKPVNLNKLNDKIQRLLS